MELNGTFAYPGFLNVASVLAKDPSTLNRALTAVLALLVTSIGLYFNGWQSGPDLQHIPVLLKDLSVRKQLREYRHNAKSVLKRGYDEYNKVGKPFQIKTLDGTTVVLNAKQYEEVVSMPDQVVSNMRPLQRTLKKAYTGFAVADAVVFRTIKTQLSTRLPDLGHSLADQADKCLASEFQHCSEWTQVQIYEHILHIVASVSTRIFVGKELADNEQWLSDSIDYAIQIMTTATVLKHIPSSVLPVIYPSIPAYRRLWKIRRTAIKIIKPIVQARREAMERPDFDGGEDNLLQWTLNERVKKQLHDKDYEILAHFQLELAFVAIHTTSMALGNLLHDLVAWPEYISILRQEVQEQLARNNGSFSGQFIRNLPKMDSFMKQSQRHNPPSITTTGRDVLEDIVLSDGTFLPKETFVVGNAWHIGHDPELLDSDAAPDVFDGLRYCKIREKFIKDGATEKAAAGKHQFVSVSSTSLPFGYGKHACPGRFFAGNEIKLLLAKLLLKYDFKMPDGETGRYESDTWEQFTSPNPERKIMMKQI